MNMTSLLPPSLFLPALINAVLPAQSWGTGASLNTPRAGCATCTDTHGRLWATGGRISWNAGPTGTASSTCEYLDPTASSPAWVQILQPPLQAREFHASACVGDFLYVFGGSNSLVGGTVYLNSAERLDLANPSAGWQALPNMSMARNALGCAVDHQGRIYVIGGSNGVGSVVNTVECFDTASQSWLPSVPQLNNARAEPGVASDAAGRIYAIGGGINLGTVATVERFDPASPGLGWQCVASLPSPYVTQSVTAATGPLGRIYAVVGPAASNMCLCYDPALDQWQAVAAMPTPVYLGSQAAAFDSTGLLWIVGTYPSPTPSATTYVLSGLAIQAQVLAHGAGCLGSRGVPLLQATLPLLGTTMLFALQNLVPTEPALIALGSTDTAWGSAPLPIDLGLIGMPGCFLRVSIDSLDGSVQPGFLFTGLCVPNSVPLMGVTFFAQGISFDPGLNPFGAAMSNSLQLVIGT